MAMRRPAGEGTLYQRGDGMWVGAVEIPTSDGRRRRRTVSARKRADAAAKLRKLVTQIEQGAVPTANSTTVQAWTDYWLKSIVWPAVKPNTYAYYEEHVRLHIVPHIGTRKIAKMTQEDVRQLLRTLQTNASTSTAQKAHQVLKKSLQDAINEGVAVRNVAAMVAKPKHSPGTRGALDVTAVRHLIRTALDRSDPLATRWAAAFFTGCRQSELLGLTWDRVDLERGVMDVSWQLQQLEQEHGCGATDDGGWACGKQRPGWCPKRRWNLPPGFRHEICHRSLVWTVPKTKAGTRLVPIAEPLRLLLADHKARTDDADNLHRLVWHHPDGRPINPRADFAAWKEALKLAGLDHIPLHAARHTMATLLQALGVPDDTRMAIMGHSSLAAQRGYVHVDLGAANAAIQALSPVLSIEPGTDNIADGSAFDS